MTLFPFLLLFIGPSCSSARPKGKTAAEILYKEAEELVQDGRYILATEKLGQLRGQYPYSFYATESELLMADILYKQENYVEAAQSYELFRKMHPKYRRKDYVTWQIADSFFKQLPDTYDRDLSTWEKSTEYFEIIKADYPGTQYEKKASKNLLLIQEKLEHHEVYVASFYYRTEVYPSARYRCNDALKTLKNPELRFQCKKIILDSSLALEDYNRCSKDLGLFLSESESQNYKNDLETYREKCQE